MFRIYFLIPLLIPLLFVKGTFAEWLFRPIQKWIDWLAKRPVLAMTVVGVFSFVLSASIALTSHLPVPQTHDEFGYLLLGDTFAHGRVTNPTPKMWEHFETVHEIMTPSYAAKYPPAQGMAIAVGELVGLPILGVWLMGALGCVAVCWMLMAWMPARWAVPGGFVVAVHPQVLEWSQDYWGGAVAMCGGALVLGAFRRLVREPHKRDAVWMGMGLALMANSRPFEGFLLGGLLMLGLAGWMIAGGRERILLSLRKIIAPMAVMMVLLGLEVGYYNWRVTGNPWVMPYAAYQEQYAMAPQFLFEQPRPYLTYRHLDIQKLHEDYLRFYRWQRQSWARLAKATYYKIHELGQGYLCSYLMLVPLLGLPWALREERWLRFVFWTGVWFTGLSLMGTWMFPHFAAPAAGVFFLLVMESMRSLNAWHIGTRRVGRNLVRGVALLLAVALLHVWVKIAESDTSLWYYKRYAMIQELKKAPGKSLVIVKYDADHNPHREWVYNEADLDNAKVILAQDMGEKNQELLDYYRDRKVWVVHADAANPEPEPGRN